MSCTWATCFFNGIYCYIDKETSGSIGGMIAGTTKMLAMVDNDTKIVPGHGPLGKQIRSENVSGHAGHRAGPRAETEVFREIS